ncbi:MAG TPA: hypothetical protein VK172_14880 [Lentimicrobium sp.]|nr:hypothetical protein [Lentimicrobium sp.]
MEEFIFTSGTFEGSMRFGYVNGILEQFENNAILNDTQMNHLSTHFPFRMEYLESLKGSSGVIKEITDLSFEAFWNKYEYKVDKQQAEHFWSKMSREDKLAALAGITKYKYRCKLKNTAMIYPVRYLRNRRWEDE